MGGDFDRRLTPVRDDLVAAHLAGRFPRPRKAEAAPRRVSAPTLTLSFSPAAEARRESELLFGERFAVYDEADGWAWGQAELDGYVGYVAAAGLAPEPAAATHIVAVAASHLYPEPDLKSRQLGRLSLGARCTVGAEANGYADIGEGWLFAKHLVPLGTHQADHLATARAFLGVPYLWGGRSSDGLDCSGLVQVALQRAGIAAPRDSDMQEALGTALPLEPSAWRRGDLVFFPGHVGFVAGHGRFLHANAFHMATVEEPLAEVLARADASGAGASAARRLAAQ